MKLNTKIILLILEIGLIPVLLIGMVGYFNTKQQIIDNTFAKLDAIAQIQKNRVQEIFENNPSLFSDELNDVANDYTGLGDTGETLFAKDDGKGNSLFVTTTRFDSKAAFTRTVLKEQTRVPAVHAVAGYEGIFKNAIDYRGIPVFAATRYITKAGLGIVVKIDQAEALASVEKLWKLSVLLALLAGFFIILIGVVISRSITSPILKLVTVANKIAEGDLLQNVKITTRDEIGLLGQAFNIMTVKLKEFYATLEEKVRARTHDLEQANIAARNVLEDLNDEKSKVDNLVNNLRKFQLALDNASDQVIIADPEGIVVYANKAVEKITGYKPEEAVSKKAGILWHTPMPKEYYENFWHTISKEKKVFKGEIQNKRKNGELYTAEISVSPVLDEKGGIVFYVGIERDVTKEREIDKAKTEFVSLASHQLRTPLTAINWYVEMLESGDAGKLNKGQKKYLTEVKKGSARMVTLVNDLLNISRIETGRLKIEPDMVNLASLITDIIREIKPWSENLHHKISFKKEKDTIIKVSVDKTLMRQVIHNMVTNAVRYSPASKNISVSLVKKDNEYVVCVSDEGIGIPKNVQNHIFEKFFRADNARAVEGEGSGIGMYLSKSITEASGAKIWFESPTLFKKEGDKEIGYGTTFYLSIPMSGMKINEGEKSLT